jgi:hypothetical protein
MAGVLKAASRQRLTVLPSDQSAVVEVAEIPDTSMFTEDAAWRALGH